MQAFEAASGAILNQNCKSVVLSLWSWVGRQDWPLSWLQVATSVKAFGAVFTLAQVVFTLAHKATAPASWDKVLQTEYRGIAWTQNTKN